MELHQDAIAYDTELDRLVDTQNISYSEARTILGEPPYELYETATESLPRLGYHVVSRVVRRPRRRSGNGPQWGEESGVGYLDEEPHYFKRRVPLSSEQAATQAKGLALARRTLAMGYLQAIRTNPAFEIINS